MSTLLPIKRTKKDFETDQDVRWCPGCGDYAILATVQKTLAQMGVNRENTVFVSGIGCSSRFPYYMQTYGFHSIHGRAPAIASGLKVARPELSIWVVTGDGDGLSIGGNHLMHALRRNIDFTILLFNNRIYGLTKGQYSPTSEVGTKAPSTPMGSIDHPINPLALAIGAGATFVARVGDTDAKLLSTLLQRAHDHKGCAIIEILQNCPVFNDGVFAEVLDRKHKNERLLVLEDKKPLTWGNKDQIFGLKANGLHVEIVEVGPDKTPESELIHHQEDAPPAYPFLLAHLDYPKFPLPVGILHCTKKPSYDEQLQQQIALAVEQKGKGDLETLLKSGMTWTVE